MRLKLSVLLLTITTCISASLAGPVLDIKSLHVGDKAPDFTITSPDGKTINLSSLKGSVVFLDFWASWCQPCRMANIDIVPLYHKYNPLGFEIFSVSMDSRKDHWINAIKSDKLVWPNHGSELIGFEQSKVAQLYNVEGLPATFLIDEEGYIIDKGFDDYDLEVKLHNIFFEEINFYPLTANAKLYFTSEAKYSIEDLSGRTILKGKGQEIDITSLPNGNYNINYDKKKTAFVKKKNTETPATFYPLRASSDLTLSKRTSYEIFNQRGKLKLKGTDNIVDVSMLKPGLYYISIEGHVSSFHRK